MIGNKSKYTKDDRDSKFSNYGHCAGGSRGRAFAFNCYRATRAMLAVRAFAQTNVAKMIEFLSTFLASVDEENK